MVAQELLYKNSGDGNDRAEQDREQYDKDPQGDKLRPVRRPTVRNQSVREQERQDEEATLADLLQGKNDDLADEYLIVIAREGKQHRVFLAVVQNVHHTAHAGDDADDLRQEYDCRKKFLIKSEEELAFDNSKDNVQDRRHHDRRQHLQEGAEDRTLDLPPLYAAELDRKSVV